MNPLVPVMLAVYCCTAMMTASANDGLEDDLFFDIPVVLSASNLDQPVTETPVAVTSIDREIIEASGARNIPDLLRLVPGVQVGYSLNEFGDEPRYVVTYHGHSDQYSRQMQVLIDGRSIYEPVLGGVNWGSVPVNVDDIEKIEVVRGPNASTFGSNSFLAVINIITRQAAEDSGQYARVNAGSGSIADITYRFADQTEDLDYRITLTSYNDAGAQSLDGNDTPDDIGTNAIDYRLDFQLNDDNRLTYQGGYSDSTQESRAGTRPDSLTTQRDVENLALHQYFRLESNIDENDQLKVQYYYNLFDKTDQFTAPVDFGTIPLDDAGLTALGLMVPPGASAELNIDPFDLVQDESFKSERHNLEVTHYHDTEDGVRIIWGAGAQKDIGTSQYYFGTPVSVSREIYRAFGNAEIDLSHEVKLNLGLLWEDSDLVGDSTSPRIALIANADERNSFRLGYSEAIRTLFLVEQFADLTLTQDVTGSIDNIQPSPPLPASLPFATTLLADVLRSTGNLETELIRAREISWHHVSPANDFRFSARGFRNSISRLIDTPAIPSAIQLFPGSEPLVDTFDNLISTTVKGVDVEVDVRVDPEMRVIANATLMSIDGSFDPADATATNPVASLDERALEYGLSAPDKSMNLMLIKRFGDSGYTGSLRFNYVGDMGWLDTIRTKDPIGRRNTGGVRKLDMRVARDWRSADYDVTLALNLINVIEPIADYDTTQQLDISKYELDRAAYLELRIRHQ